MKVGWARQVNSTLQDDIKHTIDEEETSEKESFLPVSPKHTVSAEEGRSKIKRKKKHAADAKKRHADGGLQTREDNYAVQLESSHVFRSSRHKWMFYRTMPSTNLAECSVGKPVDPKPPKAKQQHLTNGHDKATDQELTGAIADLVKDNPGVMESKHLWMFKRFHDLSMGHVMAEEEAAKLRAEQYENDIGEQYSNNKKKKKDGKKVHANRHQKKKDRARKKESHGQEALALS